LRDGLGTRLKLHINPGNDTSMPFQESLEKILKFKPHSLSINYKKVSLELIKKANAAEVEAWPWTLTSPEMPQGLAVMHVDAIKTDTPTALLNVFNKRH